MADVLVHGDDGEPPRRSPSGLLTGAAALLLLAGIVVAAVRDERPRPTGGPTTGPTADWAPSPVGTSPAPDPPPRVRLRTLRGPTGLVVLAAGERVSRIDVDRRRRTPLTPRHPGGWVLVGVPGGAVAVPHQPLRPPASGPVHLVRRTGSARRIGTAGAVAPARSPRHVWFVRAVGGDTSVRRHDLAGRPAGPEVRLRGGFDVVRETAAGLVVRGHGGTWLADRRTGRLRATAVSPSAAITDDAAVSLDGCVPCRAVAVTPLAGGPARRIALPRAFVTEVRPVVSPDDRLVAFHGHSTHRQPEPYVVDLLTFAVVRIPARLPAYPGTPGAWSRDGRRLVATLDSERGSTLVVLDRVTREWRVALRNLPYISGVVLP